MNHLNELIAKLELDQNILLEDIPGIDLYMDQVIQLFENKFKGAKRSEGDKILTKTMINNYAKGKLFFPVKNKKYSKEHIILISLIYHLKGTLSIGDIKSVLEGINERTHEDSFDLEQFYESYLHLYEQETEVFRTNLGKMGSAVQDVVAYTDGYSEELQKVMLILSLANLSNLYRRAAEQLVDSLPAANNPDKGKTKKTDQ